MSIYMDPEGRFPRYVGDIRLVVPGWKDVDPLPAGWVKLEESVVPKESGKRAEFDTPLLVDGKWHVQYRLVDFIPLSRNDPAYEGMPDKLKEQLLVEKWPTE